ncbi:hypothetical protein Bca4012_063148 [Brassica carinata]
MTDSPLSSLREERIREILELEIEFCQDDYLKRLRFGVWEPHVRNQALDWILKVCAHCSFGTMCTSTTTRAIADIVDVCSSSPTVHVQVPSHRQPPSTSWSRVSSALTAVLWIAC